jgi:pyruvate dehydrogenase E2 component (dihydrolipoyllysine-residue acetyltransferase)
VPELLRMPEVATSTTEAVLVRWPLPVNAAFKARDTLATIETDKAAIDVEAESDGVLLATLVDEGAEVQIGAPIALLGRPGERVDDLAAALAEAGVQPPAADAKSSLALELPEADREPAPAAPSLPATPSLPVEPPLPESGHERSPERIFSSPLARRIARDADLSLEQIEGTGPGGRVVRRDVAAAIAKQARGGPYVDRPHTRIRRAIAARLLESKQTAPHFYLRASARVDFLLRLREEVNEVEAVRISVNDLIVKAVAHAHRTVPEMNVIWTPDAVRAFSAVDIGVAVATEGGLVTPVLRAVETLTIDQIAVATKDFAERARNGALRQHELEGGSITVTNLGMFGAEEFAAIINPPQSAVLAVGAVTQEPVVEDGNVRIASVIRLTLSVDHRPVDGATAAGWMQSLVGVLAKPTRLVR